MKLIILDTGFLVPEQFKLSVSKVPHGTLCGPRSALKTVLRYFFSISSNFSTLPIVPRLKLILMYPVNFFSMRALIISMTFDSLSISKPNINSHLGATKALFYIAMHYMWFRIICHLF